MKIPTLEELIEISKTFRLEDLSDEYEIELQKQINDFTLKISIEIDNIKKELCSYNISFTYNDQEFDIDYQYDMPDSSFEEFIGIQIHNSQEIIKNYQKIIKLLDDIEEIANYKNLDLEIVRNIIDHHTSEMY